MTLTQRLALDATSATLYEADAWHLDLPAQSATTGIIGQYVFIKGNTHWAGQMWKMPIIKMQSTNITNQHDTGKGITTC